MGNFYGDVALRESCEHAMRTEHGQTFTIQSSPTPDVPTRGGGPTDSPSSRL